MAEYGKRLAELHLMPACASHADRQSPDLDSQVAKFQGTGDKRVDKIKFDKKSERVYINQRQHFEGLEENVWQYRFSFASSEA